MFERYKEKVYSLAWQIVKLPFLAEDVMQDVFVSLWQKRASLIEIDNPPAYLQRITRNRSIDELRKIQTEQNTKNALWEQLQQNQTIANASASRQLEGLINKAIEQLPPKRKEVFLMSRTTDMSYQAIADASGLSKNTVKTHLQLAMKEVREYLVKHHYFYFFLFFLKKF